MEENTKNRVENYAEKGVAVLNKPDRRKFNTPKSAGNKSFKKHNKLKFMLTERVRRLNK